MAGQGQYDARERSTARPPIHPPPRSAAVRRPPPASCRRRGIALAVSLDARTIHRHSAMFSSTQAFKRAIKAAEAEDEKRRVQERAAARAARRAARHTTRPAALAPAPPVPHFSGPLAQPGFEDDGRELGLPHFDLGLQQLPFRPREIKCAHYCLSCTAHG